MHAGGRQRPCRTRWPYWAWTTTSFSAIQRVRIERAKTLLAGTDLPIKHIAQQAGFKTVQYLTRAFHRVTGGTPAAFRRQSSRVSEF
jgi:AraC family transcriptional regulator